MAEIILIDTDILIDVGRDVQEAIDYLKRIEAQSSIGISVITELELIVGCRNKRELTELGGFLQRFQGFSLNAATSNFLRLPVERVDQSGQETSFASPFCGAVTTLTTPKPGIEQVPHGIAEHVEGVDDNRQGKTGKERQPGRHLHVGASFPAEHATPAG